MYIAPRIEEHGALKFRITMVLVFFIVLFLVVVVRLFEKQVVQHEYYSTMAYNQRYREERLKPVRGEIFVSDVYSDTKYPLVANKTLWAVMIIPNQIIDNEELARGLGPIIGMEPVEILQKLENDPVYIPPLKHKLSDDQRKAIEALHMHGIVLIPEAHRYYPEGTMGAKFLGFVDNDGEGRYGIEGYLNEELKGEQGKLIAERDVLGRQITVVDNKLVLPKNGQDIVLTVDRVIQFISENAIKKAVELHKADSGSVVVMDPKTGGILALAEFPSFNPEEYDKVEEKDYSIFKCMAVTDAYESGSIFKPIAMGMGLDTGEVTPDTGEYFDANVKVDDYTIWNSQRKPYGYETMTQVLENSDNVGMVWMIKKVGKNRLYDYLDKFKFGQPTGIEIEGESIGSVQDKDYVPEVGIATTSFGQGISVTEMQMLQAMGAIANNGLMVQPHLVKQYINRDGSVKDVEPNIVGRAFSDKTSKELQEMLVSVVERGHGKMAKVKGYKIGGKTGTAQIPLQDRRGYETDKFTGSFLGLGPTDDPLFVMITRINVPRDVIWAETVAAPTFGEIAKGILDYYQVPPDKEWAKEQTDREKGKIK
ncbi:MAG: penicillin-binding protein 2 [Patescibacteria group bacterium]